MSYSAMSSRSSYSATNAQFSIQDSSPHWAARIGVALIVVYVAHRIFVALDKPILSPLEILWNCLVFLMPASLISCLASRWDVEGADYSNIAGGASAQHAAKSDLLRKVFRLDAPPATKSTKSKIPAGLGNWDNSCYQNSVLQALASVGSLKTFLQIPENLAQVLSQQDSVAALRKLTSDLNDTENCGRRLWTPPKLKSMSSWQQQDAQEYYSKVVEELAKDVGRFFQISDPGLKDVGNDFKTMGNTRRVVPNAIPENPLEGLLAQRVGCTHCGYVEGISLIPFNCITVPLGREWEYNIKDCLNDFTSLESIDGVECAKCTLLQTEDELRQLCESLDQQQIDVNDDQVDSNDEYRIALRDRLAKVAEALDEEDFEERTLQETCQIPSHLRTSSVKSRQAVVMKRPDCLVIHVNRSLFDEYTGAQLKNYANVTFPLALDLTPWCAGSKAQCSDSKSFSDMENWELDPRRSLLPMQRSSHQSNYQSMYELRAVITHYGRHENGHYICYRKVKAASASERVENSEIDDEGTDIKKCFPLDEWWRFSDDDVSLASEDEVVSQGGAFMLFYERVDSNMPSLPLDQGLMAGSPFELANMPTFLASRDPFLSPSFSESSPATPSSLPSLANSSSSDDELDRPSERVSKEINPVVRSGTEQDFDEHFPSWKEVQDRSVIDEQIRAADVEVADLLPGEAGKETKRGEIARSTTA